MPSPPPEVKRVHNQLLVRLDKTFDSKSDTFRGLQRMARDHLYAGEVDRCKSMHDLLERLQGKGVIKIGEYSKLKDMLHDAGCGGNEALDLIEEAEEDIRNLGFHSNTKKTRQKPEEESLESDTTDPQRTAVKQVAGSQPTPHTEMKTSYGNGKGFCLIINNFSENREGAEQDIRRLTSFLESVNCNVHVEPDCNREQALRCLEDCVYHLKTRIPQRYAFFICVIMSHGDQHGIKTMDDQRITMEEVMARFTNDKLPDFVGKPKIFLVQACRGPSDQSAHAVADDEEVSDLIDDGMRLPKDADMLLVHATTPGYRAWRRVLEGSWFFQSLLDILERHHNTEHLEDMLTCLRGVIATQRQTVCGVKQMPCTYSTLTKCLYFRN